MAESKNGIKGFKFSYKYSFHSRWLKKIIKDQLTFEDFFLSLRFSAFRNPDVYNDHILGMLKFNDKKSLKAKEIVEKSISKETTEVISDNGKTYQISKYCPHAGADLENCPVKNNTIICLLNNYTFDLETGECLTGNCKIFTKLVS